MKALADRLEILGCYVNGQLGDRDDPKVVAMVQDELIALSAIAGVLPEITIVAPSGKRVGVRCVAASGREVFVEAAEGTFDTLYADVVRSDLTSTFHAECPACGAKVDVVPDRSPPERVIELPEGGW